MSAAFITIFAVIIISLIINRIATTALTLTGMSREVARFQARSALTGSGFTTNESEKVMSHPIRRRILMTLMLVGNAGIVTVMASTVLAFVGNSDGGWISQLEVIVVGIIILLFLAKSTWVDRHSTRIIRFALRKWTNLDISDSASLIYLGGDYQVSELGVEQEDWLADKSLIELSLVDEGILVLGIQKPGGEYIGTPLASTHLKAGDVLLIYGRGEDIYELDSRRRGLRGEVAHAEAVHHQKDIIREQRLSTENEQN